MTSSRLSRGQLAVKAIVRLIGGILVLLGVFLLPAGTTAYWEAWVYIAILFGPIALVLVYLLLKDPELLERRLKTKEKSAEQALIIKLGAVCYVFLFLIPGFDRRFGWSQVPVAAVVVADIFVFLGYALFFLVLRENRYASRVVEVEEGQRVVTSGPYAVVRHPMYLAVLVMFLFTPMALGSWWAMIPAWTLVPLLSARISNEEKLLIKELKGYREYMKATKHRLIPGGW